MKHKKRTDRYHLKDFAESVRNIDFQLKQMADMRVNAKPEQPDTIEVKEEVVKNGSAKQVKE